MEGVDWGEGTLIDDAKDERVVEWETDELFTEIEVAFVENEVDEGTVENGETIAVDGRPVTLVILKGACLFPEESALDTSEHFTAIGLFFVDVDWNCWLSENKKLQ